MLDCNNKMNMNLILFLSYEKKKNILMLAFGQKMGFDVILPLTC